MRDTFRSQNLCHECGRTWFPRGQDISAKCPGCGSADVGIVPPPPPQPPPPAQEAPPTQEAPKGTGWLTIFTAVLAALIAVPVLSACCFCGTPMAMLGGLFGVSVAAKKPDAPPERPAPPRQKEPAEKKQGPPPGPELTPEQIAAREAAEEKARKARAEREKAEAEEAERVRARRDFVDAVRGSLDGLKDASAGRRAECLGRLARVGPKAMEAAPSALGDTLALLTDPDRDVRDAAFAAASSLGGSERAALPALLTALKEARPPVRAHACALLAGMKPRPPEVAPALAGCLVDEKTRAAAADALASIGKDAVPHLLSALKGENAGAHAAAARALGKIGADAATAVPVLVGMLAAAESRAGALEALPLFKEAAVPALIEGLGASDAEARRAAVMTLGHIGPPAKGALEALEKIHYHDDVRKIRDAALTAMDRIKRKK